MDEAKSNFDMEMDEVKHFLEDQKTILSLREKILRCKRHQTFTWLKMYEDHKIGCEKCRESFLTCITGLVPVVSILMTLRDLQKELES